MISEVLSWTESFPSSRCEGFVFPATMCILVSGINTWGKKPTINLICYKEVYWYIPVFVIVTILFIFFFIFLKWFSYLVFLIMKPY